MTTESIQSTQNDQSVHSRVVKAFAQEHVTTFLDKIVAGSSSHSFWMPSSVLQRPLLSFRRFQENYVVSEQDYVVSKEDAEAVEAEIKEYVGSCASCEATKTIFGLTKFTLTFKKDDPTACPDFYARLHKGVATRYRVSEMHRLIYDEATVATHRQLRDKILVADGDITVTPYNQFLRYIHLGIDKHLYRNGLPDSYRSEYFVLPAHFYTRLVTAITLDGCAECEVQGYPSMHEFLVSHDIHRQRWLPKVVCRKRVDSKN